MYTTDCSRMTDSEKDEISNKISPEAESSGQTKIDKQLASIGETIHSDGLITELVKSDRYEILRNILAFDGYAQHVETQLGTLDDLDYCPIHYTKSLDT